MGSSSGALRIVLPEHSSEPGVMRFLLGGEPLSEAHLELLRARLLRLGGVSEVALVDRGCAVSVEKGGAADWRELGPRVIALLEVALQEQPPAQLAANSRAGRPRISDLELTARVLRVLEVDVRPYVASHGGQIELVDVMAGRARVELSGACEGCPGAASTLRDLVSERVRDAVPEITAIEIA